MEVKVGLRSLGKVEILNGLEPGDTVITTGQQRVQRDGTVVTVMSPGLNGTPKPKAKWAASPARAAVQASTGALASLPAAVSGSNPRGTLVPEARSAPAAVPTRKTAPASPAARNPA